MNEVKFYTTKVAYNICNVKEWYRPVTVCVVC